MKKKWFCLILATAGLPMIGGCAFGTRNVMLRNSEVAGGAVTFLKQAELIAGERARNCPCIRSGISPLPFL